MELIVKTIAGYKPTARVRQAVELLAAITRQRQPEDDAMWIVAVLVRSDAHEQGILISALGGEAEAWLAEAIAKQ